VVQQMVAFLKKRGEENKRKMIAGGWEQLREK